MSATVYKALEVEAIIKIIEAEGIEAIPGRPTCHTLIKLLNQLGNGARNIPCEYSQYGMLWLVQPQNIYRILTGENIVAPIDPGLFPAYQERASTTANTIIQIRWQKNKELYEMRCNTDKALIQIAKSKIDPSYREQLTDLFVGVPDRTFEAFYARVFAKWGRPTPMDITANNERMAAPWDPTTDMAVLIKQIKDGSVFAYMVGHGKQDKDLVTIGEKLILESGHFATQYQNWKRRGENDRTWTDFNQYWTTEYDLWHETAKTATQLGYGGNAENSPDPYEMAAAEQAYYTSLQQFGATNQHNAQTFNNLSDTNKELVNNMAAQIHALTKQMEGLACAMQSKTLPGYQQPYYPQPPQQQGPPHQYPMQQPPHYAPPQYQQPYAPQYQGGYQGGRGRGRGRGRGYGRGRGRGYNQGQQNYQVSPNNYQGRGQQQARYHAPPNNQQRQGFYNKPVNAPYSNTNKTYHNWNYCWSHGFDVEDGHTSQTCPEPVQGHVYYATRDNPCDGCVRGRHKTNWT